MKHVRMMLAMLPAALLLAGCMSQGPTRAERLALYQAHAGEPVRKIHYYSPIGWEELDDDHIVLTMRPTEAYLLRLSGPCLDFAGGSPALAISSTAGYVSSGFDRVSVGGSNLSCRIEEIRPIDNKGLRAARDAQAPGA